MRPLSALACAVLLFGCARSDEPAPEDAPEPVENPLTAYAGAWEVQSFAIDSDEPLVDLQLFATESTDGWSMAFDHLDEPVPGHVTVQGDSVSFTVGPYSSALREAVMVTTTSVLHADGDEIAGRFTATYEDSEPAILKGRLRGSRAE